MPTLTAIPDILALLDSLDNHLAYRTFLVGHDITAADFIIWGSIKGSAISQVVDIVVSDIHQLHQNLLGFSKMGSSMFIFFGGCLTSRVSSPFKLRSRALQQLKPIKPDRIKQPQGLLLASKMRRKARSSRVSRLNPLGTSTSDMQRLRC